MKNQLVGLVKYFFFWLIFFLLAKALFLAWNFGQTSLLSIEEIAGIFWHGLVMDVSMACYLLLLPGLLIAFRGILPAAFVNGFLKGYTILLLIVASMLIVLDLGLYPHWGTRVNTTVFNYMNDPVGIRASVSVLDGLLGMFISGSLVAGFLFIYKRFFPNGVVPAEKVKWFTLPVLLFVVAALILPIRGGLDTSPLNLSSVAFSHKMYVNQSATNYMWNFGKSVEKRKRLVNPCAYMSGEDSERIFNDFRNMFTPTQRPRLLNLDPQRPPNVILIILEGFSNKVIAPLGGLNGVAPKLDSLCTISTVFTSFYSTGNRSDRGISAILGGYPSLLSTSIMVYPEKSQSLTLLPEYFNRKHYHTSFYYGGDINFYSLKSFVLQAKYKTLVTKADFPSSLGRMSKWGVPDEYVFERATQDLKTAQQPFMKTIYTISSHPPFDVPYARIPGSSQSDQYLNSVAYTDSCLGAFIDTFRKSDLWENTLLIVTSDHGYGQPGPTDISDPASYRIPLIWSGGVVDSLQRIEIIIQQPDLGTTLIHQLGWETNPAPFAKDFFTPHPYAFYMHDSGWGYVVPEGAYYFDQASQEFISKSESEKLKDEAFPKAYMQVLHEDFIKR